MSRLTALLERIRVAAKKLLDEFLRRAGTQVKGEP